LPSVGVKVGAGVAVGTTVVGTAVVAFATGVGTAVTGAVVAAVVTGVLVVLCVQPAKSTDTSRSPKIILMSASLEGVSVFSMTSQS
jgi:hypothetical protein